jgi:hypothetical protein
MATCVPCQKEELCSQKARSLIEAGHAMVQADQWTPAGLAAWNQWLDKVIGEGETIYTSGMKTS